MGSIFTCCCKDDYGESEWYYSADSLPPIHVECELDWSGLPNISPPNYPLSEHEIKDLYQKEYLYQNRYRM
jgi:hypothetical protein